MVYTPNEKKLYLIFDFLDYDLKKFLDLHKNTLTLLQIKSYMYQILDGINYCHSRRIVHRDLKPENCLVHDNIYKVADYGFSCKVDGKPMTAKCGTPLYMSP